MTGILFKYYLKKILKSPLTYIYLFGVPVYALIFDLFIKTNIIIVNSSTFQKNEFSNFQTISINIISFMTAAYLIGLSTSILRDRYIKYEKKFYEEIARITTIIGIAFLSTIPYLVIYTIILLTNNYGFDRSILLFFTSIMTMIIMLSLIMGLLANFLKRVTLYTFGWVIYLLSLFLPFIGNRLLTLESNSTINPIIETLRGILPPFYNLLKIVEQNNYKAVFNAFIYTIILILIILLYTEGVNFAKKKLYHGNR